LAGDHKKYVGADQGVSARLFRRRVGKPVGKKNRRSLRNSCKYGTSVHLVPFAAYGTLLRSRRQQLHGRITAALESQFPEIVSAQPALLARHCVEAGLTDKAVGYWRAAGEQAVRRAANREAIGHFQQALALNEQRRRDLDCVRTELAILSQLGPALMSVHGWPVPEVGAAFERAGKVARQLESSVDLAPPLVGLFVFHTALGQFARAEEIVDELFTIARNVDDQDILLQAHHTAWPIRWFRGLHRDAITHVDAGLNLYDEVRHARHRFLYMGHDPAVCALSIGATVRWVLGYPEQSPRLEREAISLARRLQHPPSLAHALWFVGEAQIARADAAAAKATAEELLTLSDEQGLPQTRAIALMFLGWAMGQTGNIDEGLRYLEQGLAAWNALGARII
jgi:tetratricopeptide (TPR) repeat protein